MAKIIREAGRGFSVTDNSPKTVTNTSAETTLFSQVIAAGRMGLNKDLNFKILCRLTTGANPPDLTINLKFGSSTLPIASSLALAPSGTKPLLIEGIIANQESANAQIAYANIVRASGTLQQLLSGGGVLADADWTEDTTVDQTLSLTAKFSSASTTTSLVVKHVSVELS